MCRVWESVLEVDAPLVCLSYLYFDFKLQIAFFRWWGGRDPDAWQREYGKVRPYLPAWWRGILVLIVSIALYGIHCQD